MRAFLKCGGWPPLSGDWGTAKRRQAAALHTVVPAIRCCLLLLMASPALGASWYVAPGGSDTNSGAMDSPFFTITRAQSAASSGDAVYLRGGTYSLDNSHLTATNSPWVIVNNITKSGISYLAYPGELPVFDFTNVKPDGYRVTAFLVTASDCVFKGFDVVGVQVTIQNTHTQSECFRVAGGNRNRFERLRMHDGMGIGWYLTSGASNLVLNCDAWNNRGLDSGSLGNIDGFGAHPGSTSGSGNVFRGCRAWFNSDDGFDLINAKAPVVIENCWAFYNGYFTNFVSSTGDANGFKSGGYGVSGNSYPIPVPRHVTRFCVAVRNRANGFYANHHTGGLDWISNTAYRNGVNYNLLCSTNNSSSAGDVPGFDQYMKNNLGYLGGTQVANLNTNASDVSFNYFTLPVTVASNDFVSLDESQLTQPRQPDGSLPEIAFAHLVAGSDLIDAGTNVGYAFNGAAPDLGAFEKATTPPPRVTSIARQDDDMVITWVTVPGKTNTVQATTELGTDFTDIAGPIIAFGNGDVTTNYTDFGSAASYPARFYRIRYDP
jgi:hypothetical protein